MAKNIYSFLCVFVITVIFYQMLILNDAKARIAKVLKINQLLSILYISSYLMGLWTSNMLLARCWYSLKCILCLCLFLYLWEFAQCYTGKTAHYLRLRTIFKSLILVDCVLLLVNMATGIYFSVELFYLHGTPLLYPVFTPYYFFHIFLWLFPAGLMTKLLLHASSYTPRLYSKKLRFINIAVLIIVLLYFISIAGKIYLDLSVFPMALLMLLLFNLTFFIKPSRFWERLVAQIVSTADDAYLVFDQQQELLLFNNSAKALFFGDAEFPQFTTLDNFLTLFCLPSIVDKNQPTSFEYVFGTDENTRDFHTRFNVLTDKSNRTIGYYLLFTEMTVQKRMLKQQHFLATHDPLTCLPNRNYFYEITRKMLDQNPDIDYCLVYVDIDNFKIVNEFFTSRAGNRILRSIADVLRANFPGCTYARMENDHFMICMKTEDLVINEIFSMIDSCLQTPGIHLHMHASLGIYLIEDHSLTVAKMCDRAALAIQSIKDSYLDFYAFYNSGLRTSMVKKLEIVSTMEESLAQKQFELFLQPQYNHITRKIVGAEALVRWNHPDMGYISPGEFIPVFEKNGFILKLDQYMWEQACKILCRWMNTDLVLANIPISVNISRLDFYRADLCNILENMLKQYHLPVERLRLEVTESAYMETPTQMIETLHSLRNQGFVVEMDDFGSGYSSLNTLKEVPVDVLKLDMKFLNGKGNQELGGNILQSVIRMANWINMPIIAEGVEEKEQADFLESVGSNIIQGYYYSRPVPIKEFEALAHRDGVEPFLIPRKSENQPKFCNAFLTPHGNISDGFCSFKHAIATIEYNGTAIEIIRCNDAFRQVHQLDQDTFHRFRVHWFDRIHPNDRMIYATMLQRVSKEHILQHCVTRWLSSSGDYLLIKTQAHPLSQVTGREAFYIDVALAEQTDPLINVSSTPPRVAI